jgi:hypothetical protein
MKFLFANNVIATLVVQAQAADNAITVDNGAVFPSPALNLEAFYVTLQSPSGGGVEICLCTGRNGNVLTVQRGADATSPRGWAVGDTVSMRTTAANLRDFYAANYPITGGNLQGRLFLPLDPSVQNEAATKNYVDAKTANLIASNGEIDSLSPPDTKVVSAAGLRSITGGQLNSLATQTKTGLIPSINELRSLVSGAVSGSVFWGVFDASNSTITWNPGSGQTGNALPAPSASNIGRYLICSNGGASPPTGASAGTYYPGDWVISDGASVWYHLQTGTSTSVSASNVSVAPPVGGQADVQSALAAIYNGSAGYLPLTGGTMTGELIFAASGGKTIKLEGSDPLTSAIEHFSIDAGAF